MIVFVKLLNLAPNLRCGKMRKGFFLIATAMAATGICAQTEVSMYTPGITAEGVTYFLPMTSLQVAVTVEEQTYTPGEFCRYAERYLRTTGLSDKQEKSLTIKEVNVIPAGVPDPMQIYSIRFNTKSTAPLVQLTRDGILTAINCRVEEPGTEVLPTQQEPAPQPNPRDYLTEEILMAGSTAKMAELTAQEIFSIRESRNSITRGQADYVPSDGESFRYILDGLDKQEKALLQMFEGTHETRTATHVFSLVPTDTEKDKVLFRISDKLGVLDSLNLAGSPVYISVTDLAILPQSPIPSINSKNSKKENSLMYRIPGRASVKVYDNRTTYFDKEMEIAQFGNVEMLSGTLFSSKSQVSIIFDTATGNVSSVSF